MPLTSTGLTTPTLLEILDAIKADQRANIDPELDLSPASPDGQNDAIFARQLRKAYEALTALYAAGNPNGAVGAQLDYLAALTGTTRRGATYSTVRVRVIVDPGVYPAGSLVISLATRPDFTLHNVDPIVNGTAGSVVFASQLFIADEPGPVPVPTYTVGISGPVSGWTHASNPTDGTTGLDIETDSELRARRLFEVSAQGSTTVAAIAADVSRDVDGVIQVEVIENDSDVTMDGIPPHSFEAVVYGPASDDQEVARQIFESKAAGIRAYGTTTEQVQDSFGVDHAIGFTRPAPVAAKLTVYMQTRLTPTAEDETAIKDQIVAQAAALKVGEDLDWSEVVAWTLALGDSFLRVTNILVGRLAGVATGFGSVVVTRREIVTLDVGNITVILAQGTP